VLDGALTAQAQTASDALGSAAMDLAEGTQDQLLTELRTQSGRLELVLDSLSTAVDPVGVCRCDGCAGAA
jgi:hypothetical protein